MIIVMRVILMVLCRMTLIMHHRVEVVSTMMTITMLSMVVIVMMMMVMMRFWVMEGLVSFVVVILISRR